MVLRVSPESFAAEVESRLRVKDVYVIASGRHTLATAGDPATGLLIEAKFRTSLAKALDTLEKSGLKPRAGTWSTIEGEDGVEETPYVVAIAYRSEETTPGLWLDADIHEISTAEALKRMYDELRDNGEIKEASFDEFVRVIKPNVMVVPPHQIHGWADEKS
ncbi:MAG: hypothetical protein IT206_07480 [Fimbriimonadaceae bacterium]|nr:hypothetical protein [Fimbriimonadaceae bacterium]